MGQLQNTSEGVIHNTPPGPSVFWDVPTSMHLDGTHKQSEANWGDIFHLLLQTAPQFCVSS